ncbi:threonine synthase [Microbacterium enclense]|uniref:threonine synthase n=1 Tax=Microbacterium enclense TaxID=993073 RepID=UPI003F7EFEED
MKQASRCGAVQDTANGGDEVPTTKTAKFQLECGFCGWRTTPSATYRCPSCDGALEARYDLDTVTIHSSGIPEIKYFDLLPITDRESIASGTSITTPTRHAKTLGARIGLPQIWIKDESQQPTGSTKDRLAACLLAVFAELGVTHFVSSSTGNTARALARAVNMAPNMRADFFCARGFEGAVLPFVSERSRLTVTDGTYAQASSTAQIFAAENDLTWDGGFFNWARREGLKVGYLEAFDQMPLEPDVVVQAISSGMGMMAARKASEELQALGRMNALPRLLMVQQRSCAPMAKGWSDGRNALSPADVVTEPSGIATAILLGDATPYYPYMHSIARKSGGAIVDVSEDELRDAQRVLHEDEGVEVCFSSAATLAAVRQERELGRISEDDTVLLTLTGAAGSHG